MGVVVVGVVWWLNCYEGGCCGGCLDLAVVVGVVWWLLWGGVLVSTPGLPFTSLFLPKFLPCMSNHYLLTLVQRQ